MASNIMDLMGHVEAGFERGRARQKEQKFNSLASMAYGAKPQERSGYVQQAMGVDPQRALALQGFLSQGDEQKREALGRAATLILDAPDEMRASLWPQIVADLEAQGIAGMKPQWTPEALPMAERIAQAFGGAGSTRGRVQSTFVDARGKRMAVMADGSVRELGDNAPNVQIIDTGEAFYGVNKGNLRADPVQVGGAVQAPQAASGALPPDVVAAAAQRMASAGVPPEEIDAWVAQATGGSWSQGAPAAPQVGPMPAPASGGPLRKAPKPPSATFAPLSQDEIKQLGLPDGTVAQRNVATGEIRIVDKPDKPSGGGQKPIPVGALREVLESEEALAAASGVTAMIRKHTQRMVDGQLDIGPVTAGIGRLRTAAGIAKPNDVNLTELRADMTRIVNETLRLNKGVQTEGDAQRATQELMSANDSATMARALKRLAEINKRAIELQQRRKQIIYGNYGRAEQPAAQPARPSRDDDPLGIL